MHSSRERILAHLKRDPGSSVETLAQTLDLAPMTIRQHLANMAAEGLLEAETQRRPTGRPAYVYSLTAKGKEWFPKAYDRLAAVLLEDATSAEAEDLSGLPPDERQARFFRRIAARAADAHRAQLDGLHGQERVEAVVAILRDESGFTELTLNGNSAEILEYNCVYQRVAEGHNEVCTFHTEYVSQLVAAPVELEACQCNGATACRFRIVR
ncbi:MAG: winged helix-turn-helix transcriptional regulator [Dehalococcoidia bacterium]